MKIAIVIASMLVSAVASANTWIEHDYSAALRGLELNNACITETEVKSIKPVKTCTKLVPVERGSDGEAGRYTDWVCEKWEVMHVSNSRSFGVTQCAEYESGSGEVAGYCKSYETVTKFLPAVIQVRHVTQYGEYSNWPGVSKNHKFPACK